MRRSRVALFSLYAVVAILAITIGIAFTMDFGRYKDNIEFLLSDLLDREFSIDGSLRLTLGRTIDLDAEDVRIAGTQWSANPVLVGARRVTARVNTWSIISRPIVIESLTVEGVRVNLEHDAEGKNNWTLFEAAKGAEEVESSTDRPRLPILLDNTTIADAILNYDNPGRPQPFRFTAAEIIQTIDETNYLQLELHGDINDTPVELNVSAGRIDDLVELANVEIDLSGNLGEINFEGEAAIADVLDPAQPTARLTLNGPNVEYLTDILRLDRITTGPLDLSASIAPVGEKMQLRLDGMFGEFTIVANGEFVDLRQLQDVDLRVSASGPDASTIAELLGNRNVPEDPFNVVGTLRRSGSTISVEEFNITIGTTQFQLNGHFDDFPNPNGANATIRVDGPDIGRFARLIGLPGRLDGPFTVEGDLSPLAEGGARVDMTARAKDVTLYVEGNIIDAPDFSGTRVQLRFHGPNVRTITTALNLADAPAEPFDLSVIAERVSEGVTIENGSLTIGDDRLAFSGLIGNQPLSRNTDVQFSIEVLSLKDTLAGFGIDAAELPPGEFLAAGEIRSTGEHFSLHGVSASLAGADATLEGRIGGLPALDGTDINFRIQGDDFARMLPEREGFQALSKDFTIAGNIRLNEKTLELAAVNFQIDDTELVADFTIGMEPMLNHGIFSLEATSPDLFALLPQFADIAVPDEAPLELRASGDWADNLWRLNEFDMKLAEQTLRSSGIVDGPPNFDRTDLRFDWNIASINNFSVFAGHELPDEPGHLKFHLTGTREAILIDELDGVFGDSDISGEYSIRDGDVPSITISFTSNRLNLTPYLPPDQPEADEPQPAVRADKLIPDFPISIEVLQKFRADVSIQIEEMNVRQRTFQNVVLVGSVARGALTVDEFSMDSSRDGSLSGQLSLRSVDNGAELGLWVKGNELRLGLPALSEEEIEELPRYDLDLAMITSGNTVREMAGALNGYLRLVSGEGRMKIGGVSFLAQDFMLELVTTLNPFGSADPYSNLECTVVQAAIEDGIVVGEPALVLQSDRLNIFANANIDLKTEELDADFNTVARRGLGISLSNLINPYLKVGGSLANPTFNLDPESALIEGGAAIATAGISILAKNFYDRFLTSRNPCDDAVSETAEQFRELETRYGRSGAVSQQ